MSPKHYKLRVVFDQECSVSCLQVVTLFDLPNIKWVMNEKVVVDGNALTKVIGLLMGDPDIFAHSSL